MTIFERHHCIVNFCAPIYVAECEQLANLTCFDRHLARLTQSATFSHGELKFLEWSHCIDTALALDECHIFGEFLISLYRDLRSSH